MTIAGSPNDFLPPAPTEVMIEVEIDDVQIFRRFGPGPLVVVIVKLEGGLGAARKRMIPPRKEIPSRNSSDGVFIACDGRVNRKNVDNRVSFTARVEISLECQRVFRGEARIGSKAAAQQVPAVVSAGAVQLRQ